MKQLLSDLAQAYFNGLISGWVIVAALFLYSGIFGLITDQQTGGPIALVIGVTTLCIWGVLGWKRFRYF